MTRGRQVGLTERSGVVATACARLAAVIINKRPMLFAGHANPGQRILDGAAVGVSMARVGSRSNPKRWRPLLGVELRQNSMIMEVIEGRSRPLAARRGNKSVPTEQDVILSPP